MSFLKSLFNDPAARAARKEAKRVRAEEEARQGRIDEGTAGVNEAFGIFDDDFFSGRSQAFENFARPQLDDQFSDARKDLIFALSRGGKLDSSVAADRFGKLDERFTSSLQDIKNKGFDFANTARSSVEDARGSILNQLFSSEDSDAAVSSALNRTRSLATTPSFSNLGNVFQNVTAGLASAGGGAGNGFRGFLGGPTFSTSKERVIA